MRSRTSVAILALSLVLFLTGCAFGNRHVKLTYPPQRVGDGNLTAVAEAAPAPQPAREKVLLVRFLDQRANKSAVGAVHNGFGMHTADVIAQNSVPDWVSAAVRVELEKAGFEVSQVADPPSASSLPIVTGEVLKVYCSAYTKYETEVSFSARVERDGAEILRKTYQGEMDSMMNWGGSAKSYGQVLAVALQSAAKSFAAELRRDIRR